MNSIDFQEFKPYDRSPRHLHEFEELRYALLGIRDEDGQCIAKFPNGEFVFPPEMSEELVGMVGREIGILRLDGYHVRAVDDA
jgi:hypothetical protein